MRKLVKFIFYFNLIILALLFVWVVFTFTMPKMNVQMPELGESSLEKLGSISPVNPVEVGNILTDTITYTLEASTIDNWVFFDFSRGSVVTDVTDFKDPKAWDLAFRRAKIASNGGGTNKHGQVEILKLQTTDFDSVKSVPENVKFVQDIKLSSGADPKNVYLDKWYSYNFMDHHLKSHKNVLIIKTAEGNYAKMQIMNYYCKKGKEGVNGCYTLKYVYQGNGSKNFGIAAGSPINRQIKKTG